MPACRIRCAYTNAACHEIIRRTEYDPLFVVRTIHSFAWQQIQGLNSDIREWLREALQREIIELQEEEKKADLEPKLPYLGSRRLIPNDVDWSV